jgi:DNA processing protein
MEIKYNDNEKALIFLSMFDLSHKKEEELLSLFEQPKDFLAEFFERESEISAIFERGSRNLVSEMKKALGENYLKSYINNLNKKDVIVLTPYSDDYPESLKNIETPPYVLFCKGDIALLKTEGIAVVGTRTPTTYGKIVTEQFCKGLVQNGFTIISGLATGIDSTAHKTALENNGKTIAVLGGGFDHLYPSFNANLAREIVEKGLLISEYRPSFKPTLYTFPLRNRIIAGLSRGVLITEAGEKSGALHTKEYALDMGKEVFAVPGNVNSVMSKGTNRLIRSAQGACVLSYEDIVCIFHEKVVKSSSLPSSQISLDEQVVLNLLEGEEKTFEQIQNRTNLPTNKLNSMLTMLQIKGIIKQLPGNSYCLA